MAVDEEATPCSGELHRLWYYIPAMLQRNCYWMQCKKRVKTPSRGEINRAGNLAAFCCAMIPKAKGVHLLNDVEYWKYRANELRVIAKRMLHTRSREALLRIANDYEQMVELLAKPIQGREQNTLLKLNTHSFGMSASSSPDDTVTVLGGQHTPT